MCPNGWMVYCRRNCILGGAWESVGHDLMFMNGWTSCIGVHVDDHLSLVDINTGIEQRFTL